MARLEACLVDAYDTIVTCDFSPLRRGVPALADIPVSTWEDEYNRIGPLLTDGRMSKAKAFGHILGNCGIQAVGGLVAEMVRRDQELLLANARLFDDAIPFLQNLRDRGIKIAIVSNCTENTRPLLVALGVDTLADTLVLSCEVGAAKPAAEIFRCALDRLGVTRGSRRFRRRPGGLLRGQRSRGRPRGADHPGRARREEAGGGNHGNRAGPVAARSRGHVPGVIPRTGNVPCPAGRGAALARGPQPG